MEDYIKNFAYGAHTKDGCPCPVMAARGTRPKNTLVEAAERYDKYLQEKNEQRPSQGVVREEEAKEAWLEAIENLDSDHERAKEVRERAEDVAATLNWL